MKIYLGDSVYVQFTEFDSIRELVLTTENGEIVTNRIFIQNKVLDNLIAFLGEIKYERRN